MDEELDWLSETSFGGAEAGRGGGEGEEVDLPVPNDDLRLREGGESRAEFIIGVVGGVLRGVAGWRTMARLGDTSRGVGWPFLERLLGELDASFPDMVGERRQEKVPGLLCCQLLMPGPLSSEALALQPHLIAFMGFEAL